MLVGKTRWREIRYRKLVGWVNGSYLSETMPARALFYADDGKMRVAWECMGAEPFWDLKIKDNDITFAMPMSEGGKETARVAKRLGRNRSNFAVFKWITKKQRRMSLLVAHNGKCSIGMGNHDFAFDAYFMGFSDSNNPSRPMQGCCIARRIK